MAQDQGMVIETLEIDDNKRKWFKKMVQAPPAPHSIDCLTLFKDFRLVHVG